MTTAKPQARPSRPAMWIGRVLTAATVAILLADAAVNLFAPDLIRAQIEGSGFLIERAGWIGGIALACALLYALPHTAILGAILVTGFLGGAICAHLRLGEFGSPPQLAALVLGAMAWGGLYLRDARVRALLPLRVTHREPPWPAAMPTRAS